MAKKLNLGLKALVRDNLPKVIEGIAEAEQVKLASGAEKLDIAVKFLNDVVDLPLLPEYAEELVLKAVVTAVVETAKHLFGKADWVQKLTGPRA